MWSRQCREVTEIREVCAHCAASYPNGTLAVTVLQVGDEQFWFGRVSQPDPCRESRHFDFDMEPLIPGNFRCRCSAGAVIDLPGMRTLEGRHILSGIIVSRMMRP